MVLIIKSLGHCFCINPIMASSSFQWILFKSSHEKVHHSGAHMRAPPPLGQAEDDELHPRMDGGLPSAGCGRQSAGRDGSASISHT
jgi:hypothetical protein